MVKTTWINEKWTYTGSVRTHGRPGRSWGEDGILGSSIIESSSSILRSISKLSTSSLSCSSDMFSARCSTLSKRLWWFLADPNGPCAALLSTLLSNMVCCRPARRIAFLVSFHKLWVASGTISKRRPAEHSVYTILKGMSLGPLPQQRHYHHHHQTAWQTWHQPNTSQQQTLTHQITILLNNDLIKHITARGQTLLENKHMDTADTATELN